MVHCVAVFIWIAVANPGEHRIKMSLDDRQMRQSEAETTRWAEQLLDSPLAAFLDPRGHDRLQQAVEIEHHVQERGSRNLDELGLQNDIFMTTNAHQVNVHNLRWAW